VQFLPLPPDGGTGPARELVGEQLIIPTDSCKILLWVIKAHIFFDLNQDSIFFDLWGQ
jgi:hypothetical protein